MSRGGAEVIQGRDEKRAFFEEWLAAYDQYQQEVEEIRDLGNGVAFAVFRQGRGRTSGVQVGPAGAKGAGLFHIVNGKITALSLYANRDRALADLGLED